MLYILYLILYSSPVLSSVPFSSYFTIYLPLFPILQSSLLFPSLPITPFKVYVSVFIVGYLYLLIHSLVSSHSFPHPIFSSPPLLPILSSSQSSPLLLFPSLSTILYVSGLTYTYLYSIIPILSSDPHSRLPIFYSPSSLPLISSPLLFYPFPSSIFCSPLPLSFQSSSSDLSSFLPHSCPS